MDNSGNNKEKGVAKILIADDEKEVREMISNIVFGMGLHCRAVCDGQQAIDALTEDSYDLVIADIVMPVLDGMELLDHVKRFYPSVDVLVVTGFSTDYSFTEMIGKGASDFIAKPFATDELIAKINRICRERRLVRDFRIEINAHLNAKKEIERSYQILEVVNNLLRLSMEDCSVVEIMKNFILHLTNLPWLELDPKGAAFLTEQDENGRPCLRMQAHHRLAEPLLDSCKQVPFGNCLCGRAAESREVVFADCVDDRHDITYTGMQQHGHYCIPILTGENELLGVFTLYVKEGAVRDPQAERVLTSAASMLAGVIRQKRSEEQRQ